MNSLEEANKWQYVCNVSKQGNIVLAHLMPSVQFFKPLKDTFTCITAGLVVRLKVEACHWAQRCIMIPLEVSSASTALLSQVSWLLSCWTADSVPGGSVSSDSASLGGLLAMATFIWNVLASTNSWLIETFSRSKCRIKHTLSLTMIKVWSPWYD